MSDTQIKGSATAMSEALRQEEQTTVGGLAPAVEYSHGWREIEVTAATKDGPRRIRGLAHPKAPGLAVTSIGFGAFDVTHVATGKRIVSSFERCGGACLALVHLSVCADWTKADAAAINADIEARGAEPCGFADCTSMIKGETLQMTKLMLFQCTRNWISGDEFPWESADESPFGRACAALDELPEPANV